ncbi:MAG TPA: RHS repeat-associated core domain-containing protein [Acidobacteriota bacterium]|jgi:RHS repeat-associated protein
MGQTAGDTWALCLRRDSEWVRLEVPASQVGLDAQNVYGVAFTLYGGRAWWDKSGAGGFVWFDDALPTGAVSSGANETWTWVAAPDYVTYDYLPTMGQNKLVITQGVQLRTFNYDTFGQLTSEIHPENGTTSYTYDDNGNVNARTDPRGWVTNHTYDNLNRLTTKSYLNDGGVTPVVNWVYDLAINGVGKPAWWNSGNGHSESFDYDSMGRTTQDRKIIAGMALQSVSYTYNLAGELITTTYPNGWTTTGGYDGVGNLENIASSFAGSIVSNIDRNAAGQPTLVSYGNGVNNMRSYNSDLQLSNLQVGGPGGTYLNKTYTYNAGVANNGRITSITDNLDANSTISYTYDELSRLATAATTGPAWGLSWTYDRYGNRLGQNLTKGAPPTNSLSVDASSNRVTTWTYDAVGNVTNDGRHTYAYDAENRIISIDSGATTYSYDGPGGRVQKTTGATVTRYFFGLAENVNGSWTKVFVATATGVIEWDSSNGMMFKSNDHHGDTRIITNGSGLVAGRLDMYPYGEIWSETGTINKYKNTGKERDGESGNDYFGARYYWNGAGRWLGVDVERGNIFNPQRLNRLTYCLNDPINYIDPDGKKTFKVTVIGHDPDEALENLAQQSYEFENGSGNTGNGNGTPRPLPVKKLSNDCQGQLGRFASSLTNDANLAVFEQEAITDFQQGMSIVNDLDFFVGPYDAEGIVPGAYGATIGSSPTASAPAGYTSSIYISTQQLLDKPLPGVSVVEHLVMTIAHEIAHAGRNRRLQQTGSGAYGEPWAYYLTGRYQGWLREAKETPCVTGWSMK